MAQHIDIKGEPVVIPGWLIASVVFCLVIAGFGFRVGIEVFMIRNEVMSLRYDVCKIQAKLALVNGYACRQLERNIDVSAQENDVEHSRASTR